MASSVISKIVGILIVLIVLAVIGIAFYGPEGFFNKVKEITTTVGEFLPNISFGAKELQGTPSVYTPGVEGSLGNLKSVIDVMINSNKNNCFMKFTPLPDLTATNEAGEEIVNTISFTVSGENTLVQVSDNKGNVFSSETWNFKPCVIAGEATPSVSENFYSNFLKEGAKCSGCIWGSCPPDEDCQLPYWSYLNQMQISYNSGWFTADGNKLTFGHPEAEANNNFLNGGYLFKPSPGFVCFFPTKSGNPLCDGDGAEGLDDDCLTDETEEESISYRITRAQLNYCY